MYILVEPYPGGRWNVKLPARGAARVPTEDVTGLVAEFMNEVEGRVNNDRIPEVDLKTNRTDNCIVIAPDFFLNPDADLWFVHTPDGMLRMSRPDLMARLPELMSSLGEGCGSTAEVKPGSCTHEGKECHYGVRFGTRSPLTAEWITVDRPACSEIRAHDFSQDKPAMFSAPGTMKFTRTEGYSVGRTNLIRGVDTTPVPDASAPMPTPDSENISLYKVKGGFIAVDDSDEEYVFTNAGSLAEWVGRWGCAPKAD